MCFQKPQGPDDSCVVFTSCLLPATFPVSFCSFLEHSVQQQQQQRRLRKAKVTLNSHHNQFLSCKADRLAESWRGCFTGPASDQRSAHAPPLAFSICVQRHAHALSMCSCLLRECETCTQALKRQPSGTSLGARTAFVKAASRNAETCVFRESR